MITRLPRVSDPLTVLAGRETSSSEWSAPAGHHFPLHRHAQRKHLYVIAGSIVINDVALSPGDGVVIDAYTDHSADVGPAGCRCVESFD